LDRPADEPVNNGGYDEKMMERKIMENRSKK